MQEENDLTNLFSFSCHKLFSKLNVRRVVVVRIFFYENDASSAESCDVVLTASPASHFAW